MGLLFLITGILLGAGCFLWGFNFAIMKVMKDIKRPHDQWISCSEPPKEGGLYLITAMVLGEYDVQYSLYDADSNIFICNGEPITWMHLPEPYKPSERSIYAGDI